MDWIEDVETKGELSEIVDKLSFSHIRKDNIYCMRAYNSKTRAYARTWAFPKIFQLALKVEPVYVIEIISRHFDKLPRDEQTKVLIHELMHIPRTFSGNLRPHTYGRKSINKEVKKLFELYQKL